MSEIVRVANQLDEVAEIVRAGDAALRTRVERVSGWSVGQQLDHLLQAAQASLDRILDAPAPLARRINLTGRVLLGLGWFPRGAARSPKAFEGRDRTAAEIAASIAGVRAALDRVRERPDLVGRPEAVVPHPYFRGLTGAQALRMVAVHTEHHLKIVRELRRAAAVG
jgi:hypothetical protein